MTRPERRIDAETVRRLAEYAGLPLPEERVQAHVERLNAFVLPGLESRERERLGFWFEEGRLTFVRPTFVPKAPRRKWGR